MLRRETYVEASAFLVAGFLYLLPALLNNQVFLIMRNPFRKMSPEEEFVASFLKGMKESSSFNQETQLIHALIKAQFVEGYYVAAQESVNEYTRAVTAAFRAEKRSNL